MKYTFFTPGPSQLYPSAAHHIQAALKNNVVSISHRSTQFQEIFKQATEGLRKLLQIPKDYHIVFVASGTEAMERVIQNTVDKSSFHFVNGSFSERWYEIARELGKNAKKYSTDLGKGFHKIPAIPAKAELICFTHNETSTGVAIDTQLIYNIGRKYSKTLIAIDTVSSAPYVALEYKKLDCVFFSVQKLFGLPAGLGVLILSPRAVQKAEELKKAGKNSSSYHSFPTLVTFARDCFTPETPNVLGIYVLGQIVAEMNKKGIEKIRKTIKENAQLLYEFFDKHPRYKPFVAKDKYRSQTVITIDVGEDGEKVKKILREKRIIIGNGYGSLKDTQVRIANFPAISKDDIKVLLQCFQEKMLG